MPAAPTPSSVTRRAELEALPLRRGGDELLVPHVDAVQVGEAALRERAQQVQRRSGLVVTLDHSLRVGDSRFGGTRVVVDHVAAETGNLLVTDALEGLRARFRELAGDPPQLHDRQRRAVGEHGGHLEHDLQLLPDPHRRELVERLDAVPRLEQERAALDHLREVVAQVARLAGEDERRAPLQALERGGRGGGIGPLRLLERREVAPGGGRPG